VGGTRPRARIAPLVPSFTHEDNGITFMIVSGAGPAVWTPERLMAELSLGRRVNVIATPTAASWLDEKLIRELTGWDLRCEQRGPLTPTFQPPGCRVLASPVTLNTLTKWAAGHCDNLALSLLCEATGLGIEVRAEVSLSQAYAQHPAVTDALSRLTDMGVSLYRVPRGARHALLPVTAPVRLST
jgi:phosphopantothenoylcysteine decarboxylase